ncbi:MAG: flagellar motor switch protein FliN [Spirochaetaceae bacterium]|jgi:flagellar motor switch protein FliN/FliY|nr:flagellar motor switch protein FliN [Spirochaetaceae bacterium]
MSEDIISKNEMDALFSGDNGKPSAFSPAGIVQILQGFCTKLIAALAENFSAQTGVQFQAGAASVENRSKADVLSQLPDVLVSLGSDLQNLPAAPGSSQTVGERQFFIGQDFAKKLVELVNKEPNAELDEIALTIVSETIAKFNDAEVGALSALKKTPGLAADDPDAKQAEKKNLSLAPNNVLISYPLTVDGTQVTLWEVISDATASAFAAALSDNPPQASAASNPIAQGALTQEELQQMVNMATGPHSSDARDTAAPLDSGAIPSVAGLSFPALHGSSAALDQQHNIGLILDVFMEMTVELGRTKKQVKDILGLGEGTIIELDKLAGEPVDILVNHKPIAKGEVVVIDENFGVRVTEILSPMERVSELR